jgi:N-acetyl-anhydromuramyl-L-alanine amidase AmpD
MRLEIRNEMHQLVRKRSKRERPIKMIVMHCTAGASARSSINWLRNGITKNGPVKASYDYIISGRKDPKPGIVYKLMPISTHCSWHAGFGAGPLGAGLNQYSVGISFACMDDGKDTVHPDAEAAAIELIVQIVKAHPEIEWISCHHLVDRARKKDPWKWDFVSFFTRLNAHPEMQGRTLKPWRPARIDKWNLGIPG